VSFPFHLHSVDVFDSHIPYHAHAAPLPCSDHAVLKATSQGHGTAQQEGGMGSAWHVWINIGRRETACGRPAQFRLLPATTRSSTKVVIRISNWNAAGQCETKQLLSWTWRSWLFWCENMCVV